VNEKLIFIYKETEVPTPAKSSPIDQYIYIFRKIYWLMNFDFTPYVLAPILDLLWAAHKRELHNDTNPILQLFVKIVNNLMILKVTGFV